MQGKASAALFIVLRTRFRKREINVDRKWLLCDYFLDHQGRAVRNVNGPRFNTSFLIFVPTVSLDIAQQRSICWSSDELTRRVPNGRLTVAGFERRSHVRSYYLAYVCSNIHSDSLYLPRQANRGVENLENSVCRKSESLS